MCEVLCGRVSGSLWVSASLPSQPDALGAPGSHPTRVWAPNAHSWGTLGSISSPQAVGRPPGRRAGLFPRCPSRGLVTGPRAGGEGREGTAGPGSQARPWPGLPVRVPGFRQEGTEAPREGDARSLSAGPRRARCSGYVSRVTARPDVAGGEPSYSGEGLAFPGLGPPASVLAAVGRRVTAGGNEVRGWLLALLGLVVGSSPSRPRPVHLGGWVIPSRVCSAPSLLSHSFLPSAWTVFPARFRSSPTTALLRKAVILVGSREGPSQAPPATLTAPLSANPDSRSHVIVNPRSRVFNFFM